MAGQQQRMTRPIRDIDGTGVLMDDASLQSPELAMAGRGAKIVDLQEYRRRRETDRPTESGSAAVAPIVWGYAWVPMVMLYPAWPVV
jgi:hypothetical protein